MKEMHKLLKKQLLKNFGKIDISEDTSEEIISFLDAVNSAYIDFEKDRILMERSIEISSREYVENIEKINKLQTQLIYQEKMAGIGQLSAGIAHEINNPLSFILSNTQTLTNYLNKIKGMNDLIINLSENDIEKLKEYKARNKIDFIISDIQDMLNESVEGLLRIEKIVKSLLGFSRKSPMAKFEKYDINKGIKDTLIITNNEIKYYAKVEEELKDVPSIMAVDGEINQVILNIIVNAAHAIKEKGENGTIKIRTYHKDNSVYCEIEDNGVGIEKVNINRIFEPFFTTKPIGQGTGLGLSIIHDIIVNKHKGSIDVISEFGQGTTFIIRIPIRGEEYEYSGC